MNIDKVFKAFEKAHQENPKSDKYWSYDSRESVENFIEFYKRINKPVETTNEKPKYNNQFNNRCGCINHPIECTCCDYQDYID